MVVSVGPVATAAGNVVVGAAATVLAAGCSADRASTMATAEAGARKPIAIRA
ncbi:MAG: hypothetical protein JWM89_3764 [Acidimicrobiales bacterium]|nr:hypothetical protein [Acidimicrobiales bacterium]